MVKEFVKSETRSDEKTSKPKNGTDDTNKQSTIQYINFGEEDQMEISGYALNHLKQAIIRTLYVLTVGILRLIFHWYPQWRLYATHTPCSLAHAEKLLIVDNYKGKYKTYFVKNVELLRAEVSHPTLSKSESVISINGLIFKDNDDNKNLLTVYLCDGTRKKMVEARVVRCKKLTYVWEPDKDIFVKMAGLDKGLRNDELHNCKGYTKDEQNVARITFGTNEIAVPVQSILILLVLEALTPFYMFQLFSLIVWLAEWYVYYGIAIVIMSVFGISTSIIQTRKNQQNLKGTVHSIDKVQVVRGDGTTIEEIVTTDLVPGDVIVIPSHGCDMYCDAVLLNGNCIVNESMLTGESVPVTKTSLPNNSQTYNTAEHGNHTLFCGTKIIQTRYYGSENVIAVVTRTGYLTSKGEMVRSILYPPPADFKFDQGSYKFIIILAVIAMLGFIYTISFKVSKKINGWDALIKALDIVTIAIPPALPAAMTVGKLYALNRLKSHQIYCINSRVINVSGSVDCICFDKTGTLTEDGLDMWGVVPVINAEIGPPIRHIETELWSDSLLFQGMLSCHSLTLINAELCGDPLDVKMFESTGWVLDEPKVADTSKYDLLVPAIVRPRVAPSSGVQEIGLIQQYHFSSTLQRMSVVCRRLGAKHFDIFTKGAPEMIISLSKPHTVPANLLAELKKYTRQGYRVIAIATKQIANNFHRIPKLDRDEIECDLDFVGLMVLENRLKVATKTAIQVLHNAAMKIVMITGDNIETAVSVAHECGIIKAGVRVITVMSTVEEKNGAPVLTYTESVGTSAGGGGSTLVDVEASGDYIFALSGGTWADAVEHRPEIVARLVTKGAIFARMSGAQKQQLVEALKALGYYVAMCGDGANDCGALKAAHVGISLSDAESSVASPFTSKQADIACVEHVVKEGRAALVTSFGVFKLMLCYSLTEFGSVIILYSIDSNLTPLQYLFIDICLVLNFATWFGRVRAYDQLAPKAPMTSLLSFTPLTSIVLFMVLSMTFQVLAYFFVQYFDWFTPFVFDPNATTTYKSYENYAVFAVSLFQYVIMTFVFSKGRPYRRGIWTNWWLVGAMVAMTAVCVYVIMDPARWIVDTLELMVPPAYDGRYMILVMAAVNFLLCYFVEAFVVEFVVDEKVRPKFVKDKRGYVTVEKDLAEELDVWPIRRKLGYDNFGFAKDVVVTTKV